MYVELQFVLITRTDLLLLTCGQHQAHSHYPCKGICVVSDFVYIYVERPCVYMHCYTLTVLCAGTATHCDNPVVGKHLGGNTRLLAEILLLSTMCIPISVSLFSLRYL
jgi:hypothetical protein